MTATCIGYTLQPGHREQLWERCTNPSMRGDRYCAAHRESLDGAILGLLQWEHRLYGSIAKNEDCLIPGDAYVCESCGARWEWRVPGPTESRSHGLPRSHSGSGSGAADTPKKPASQTVKSRYPVEKKIEACKPPKRRQPGNEIAVASPPPRRDEPPARC
jgi:hypothetical protein